MINTKHTEIYQKKINDSMLIYPVDTWEPILIPKIGSPEVLTGMDALKELSNKRQLIKVRYLVTGCCNIRCYHCYAANDYNKVGVSTEAAKKIIDEIANAGVFFLQLDGGEVGYRRDLSDIINHATDRGLIIDFFTNGTLFDDKFFANTNFDNVSTVVFSIHSHIGMIHDNLTNSKGSFEKAIKNIERFKNIVRKIVIKMTITKKNISSLPGLYDLSTQLGVDFAYGIDLVQQSVSPSDSLELDEDCIRWMKENFIDMQKKETHIDRRSICVGGRSSCCIDQDGNLFPCRLIDINLGNVLQKPLVELWNSDLAINVANTIYCQPAECTQCGELSLFCNYCPGRAYMKGFEKEHWAEYNCLSARRNRFLYG